jgi:HEPN superfamily AbiU2-like protein
MKQRLPLETQLDRIAQHVIRARLFLDLWFYFESAETRPPIIKTMEDYNELFRFTPHAYFVAYVNYIHGVFDKQPATISLQHLIPEMIAAGHLRGDDAATIEALMKGTQSMVEKVGVLRHRAIAHKTAHTSYNDVFQLAAVKPDQLRELTEMGLKIANTLLRAHGLPEQHFTELPREAAKAMMEALGARGR